MPRSIFGPSMGRKAALLWLCALVLASIGAMWQFRLGWNQLQTIDYVLFVFFGTWIFSTLFMPHDWFRKDTFLGALFIVETGFVLALLRPLDEGASDIYLIYFMNLFLGAMARTMVGSAGAPILVIPLYSFIKYIKTGYFLQFDPSQLIYLPFLYISSVLVGYLAEETSKELDEKKRLRTISTVLAEKVDLATAKLTETNRNMRALLEYHKRILTSIQTGIIVVHHDGKIKTFNEYAAHITGFLVESVENQTLETFPKSLEPIRQVIQKTMDEARSYSIEQLEITSARGEKIPISIQTSVMRGDDGTVLGAIVTFRDISLLRQMETQLSRAERLSALGEMAAGVAHEIKNPLNAIQGFSQRLATKIEDPNLKKYAETIVREVQRLDTTINDVLEYSRTAKPVKQPTNLQELLDEVLQYASEKMERSNVRLEKRFPADFPPVPLDFNKMKQVFLNIILNAVHAMSQGGTLTITATVKKGLKDSSANDPGDWVSHVFLDQRMAAIYFQDTGSGISRENITKLFHPFFTTKTTGTGLGLSICHKIVAAHGGTISVDSTEGVGTTFTIELPLDE